MKSLIQKILQEQNDMQRSLESVKEKLIGRMYKSEYANIKIVDLRQVGNVVEIDCKEILLKANNSIHQFDKVKAYFGHLLRQVDPNLTLKINVVTNEVQGFTFIHRFLEKKLLPKLMEIMQAITQVPYYYMNEDDTLMYDKVVLKELVKNNILQTMKDNAIAVELILDDQELHNRYGYDAETGKFKSQGFRVKAAQELAQDRIAYENVARQIGEILLKCDEEKTDIDCEPLGTIYGFPLHTGQTVEKRIVRYAFERYVMGKLVHSRYFGAMADEYGYEDFEKHFVPLLSKK